MAQRFKAKTLISNSGVFNNEVIAPNLVYNTGNQTISGVKTFATGIITSGNLQVSGTGIFNAIDLNSIDNLSLSGVDITITSGIVTLTNAPILSGNPLITGNLSLYATTVNLISTGSRIDALSGNLITTGSRIDTLSGNLITTGSRIDALSGQVVFTTGNQTISGIKSFATGIDIINSGNPQNLRIFNKTGTNTGEFGIFGWNNNQLTIGAQQTNSGILRDVILTGANINFNPISGSVTTNGSGIFSLSGALASGLPNNPLSVVGSGNTYIQLNIQNRATGTNATADLVITANNGTDSSNYINLGINNSGYNDGGFTNGTGYDGYLFIDGGNLDIGTKTAGRFIEFHAGGTNQNNTIVRITESGFNILSGNLTVSGNATITGHLSASSKSFLIDHPTQLGKKLQYGSLEGPEHGVFVRGKTSDTTINLPNYWASLVDENSISVNLTPIDVFSNIYVIEYDNRRVVINGNNGNDYFYTVYGERKDIPKLTVEF